MSKSFFIALLFAFLIPNLALSQTQSDELTIAFSGDIYIDAPTRRTIERRAEVIGRDQAFRELLADPRPTLHGADLTIVNLETPVCPRYIERQPGDPPIFNASTELLDSLVHAGVDAVTLGNNHAFDQGLKGLHDTLKALSKRNLPSVGIGTSPKTAAGPLKISTKAGTVALCNWTQSLNVRRRKTSVRWPSLKTLFAAMVRDETLGSCIRSARKSSALTIAAFHWTPSVWKRPLPEERALVRKAANAGADIVIGHGPHVPGPVSYINSKDGRKVLVLSSLGNLVGAMNSERERWIDPMVGVRDSPIIVVTTRRSTDGRLQPTDVKADPFWISDPIPGARWWKGGQRLTRPLSIRLELERLARTRCGPGCAEQARGYKRRVKALARALGLEIPLSNSPNSSKLGSTEQPQTQRLTMDESLDELVSGITLPIRFPSNGFVGKATDPAEINRIAKLLIEHRTAEIQVTGFAAEDEDRLSPKLMGFRRARSAMWIVAAKGPSRSRFKIIGSKTTADEPRVILRILE